MESIAILCTRVKPVPMFVHCVFKGNLCYRMAWWNPVRMQQFLYGWCYTAATDMITELPWCPNV
eukprot:2752883-Amphidinium_carterae.1